MDLYNGLFCSAVSVITLFAANDDIANIQSFSGGGYDINCVYFYLKLGGTNCDEYARIPDNLYITVPSDLVYIEYQQYNQYADTTQKNLIYTGEDYFSFYKEPDTDIAYPLDMGSPSLLSVGFDTGSQTPLTNYIFDYSLPDGSIWAEGSIYKLDQVKL